jgi:hypothetical protein
MEYNNILKDLFLKGAVKYGCSNGSAVSIYFILLFCNPQFISVKAPNIPQNL